MFAFCNNMDRPGGYYAEWNSQTEKDKYSILSLICGTQDKKQPNESNRTDSQTQGTNCGYLWGEERGKNEIGMED